LNAIIVIYSCIFHVLQRVDYYNKHFFCGTWSEPENRSPARLLSPSLNVQTHSSLAADTNTYAMQTTIQDQSEPAYQLKGATSTIGEPSPAIRASDIAAAYSIGRYLNLTPTKIRSSAPRISVIDGDCTDWFLCTYRLHSHNLESGKSPLHIESIELERVGAFGTYQHISSRSPLNEMHISSGRATSLLIAIVVILASFDLSDGQDAEEHNWDSAPSDDENNVRLKRL
jgi:hypothetical protein